MYRVYVDSIGEIDQTTDSAKARRTFEAYKDMSQEGYGNVGGKRVLFYKDKEIIDEFKGDKV